MNLKDRQNQLNKAKNFIKGGAEESPKPKQTSPLAKQKPLKKKSGSPKKKDTSYYLEVDLVQRIQIQAIKNGERPCHLVTRAVEKLLKKEETREES